MSRHPEVDSAWKALWSDITDHADDPSRVNYERLCAAIENYSHKRIVARLRELGDDEKCGIPDQTAVHAERLSLHRQIGMRDDQIARLVSAVEDLAETKPGATGRALRGILQDCLSDG